MSSTFDLFSSGGNGTVVLSRLWPRKSARRGREPMQVGIVQVCKPGEEICGDSHVVLQDEPDVVLIMIADGLGHGPLAYAAASEAVRVLHSHRGVALERLMALRHPAVIAGVLYRDFNRGRDDVTVIAVRETDGAGSSS